MAIFVVREKNKKKKLYAGFTKSIGVYAASDARGQYLKIRKNKGNKIFIRRN